MSAAEELTVDESEISDINPNQYVTFIVGEECFAVDMNPVQEIIRVPEVVRVPLAPPALSGLSNLRGKVLPILSLRHLFGFDDIDQNEATRAVVVDVGQPLGFVVDRVSSVIEVDPNQIEGTECIKSSIDTRVLRGVIKQSENEHMVMILDFGLLIEHEFAMLSGNGGDNGITDGLLEETSDSDEEIEDILQLVSFALDSQEYAIDINDVKEIVQVPEQITALPQSAPHILGLINLRGNLLPLIDLRVLFALSYRELDEKSRIVVLAFGTYRIGVVVDAVSEVLRVPQSAAEGLVPFMAREAELSDITDICRLNDGKRLVSILSVERLFGDDNLRESLDNISEDVMLNEQENEAAVDSTDDDDSQVVVFRLDGEEFAVPITSIQEIVRIPEELIHVPRAPSYLEGVINLRGIVLPVVDLRVRLGMNATERSERQRIVVFMIRGVRTGFIVDQVTEVLKIPDGSIEPSPKIVGENGAIFSGMANIQEQKRMIQLIEPDALIDDEEASELEQVSEAE